MSVYTYKCPNCDGGLVFDPAGQDFACEYCMSRFTREQVQRPDQASGTPQPEADATDDGVYDLYSCPSCGAEVAADETTAASFCYYCHNPVVLSGRLSGEFKPHAVIPFAVDREQAAAEFLAWGKKKWFAPKWFFSKEQIDKLTGIYFPYWLVDCRADGSSSATAIKTRVWRAGKTEYTETSFYDVQRKGQLSFADIPRNALSKNTLVNAVHPYRTGEAKPFEPAYLTGFQAEKRDIESDALSDGVTAEMTNYSKTMLRGTIKGYTAIVSEDSKITPQVWDWKYTLLPAWVVTSKSARGKVFYYAVNGQTKKVAGLIPVDYKKLALVSAAVTAVVAGLGLLLGGMS